MSNYEKVKINPDSDEMIRIVIEVKASKLEVITTVELDRDDERGDYASVETDYSEVKIDGLTIVDLENNERLNDILEKAWLDGHYTKIPNPVPPLISSLLTRTHFSVSPEQPKTFDKAGFDALTYTEVK